MVSTSHFTAPHFVPSSCDVSGVVILESALWLLSSCDVSGVVILEKPLGLLVQCFAFEAFFKVGSAVHFILLASTADFRVSRNRNSV